MGNEGAPILRVFIADDSAMMFEGHEDAIAEFKKIMCVGKAQFDPDAVASFHEL